MFANRAEASENTFYIWWTILIVKTQYKGCWLRYKYCNQFRVNEVSFIVLDVFCDWLES